MSFILELNGIQVPGSNATVLKMPEGSLTATGYAYISTPAAPNPSALEVVNISTDEVMNITASISILEIA
jgi:hypothetical protein